MGRGLLHHLDLTVRDLAAAAPFYDLVLGHMGYSRVVDRDSWIDYGWHGQPFPAIAVCTARGPNAGRLHDRYSPGLHHVAFTAESEADVDALYAKLVEAGVTILDPPAAYPEYGEGYYAVFFADPDGLKLEYVYSAGVY